MTLAPAERLPRGLLESGALESVLPYARDLVTGPGVHDEVLDLEEPIRPDLELAIADAGLAAASHRRQLQGSQPLVAVTKLPLASPRRLNELKRRPGLVVHVPRLR